MTKFPPDAAIDDVPEYLSEMLGSTEVLPEKELVRTSYSMKPRVIDVLDQSEINTPDTKYACGSAATTQGCNIMNNIEWSGIYLDYVDRRDVALDWYDADIKAGSTMMNQIQQMLDEELIKWYYFVSKKVNAMCTTLDRNNVIFTGSRNINWKETRKSPYLAVEWTAYGHFFLIVGYDMLKRHFICLNSYGEVSYDEWYFYLSFDDIDLLFTMCALVDKENLQELQDNVERIIAENPKTKIWWEIMSRNRSDLTYGQKMSLFIDYVMGIKSTR